MIIDFDDNPLIVPRLAHDVVIAAVKAMGAVTEWKWKGGEKDLYFPVRCKALGGRVQLSGGGGQWHRGGEEQAVQGGRHLSGV